MYSETGTYTAEVCFSPLSWPLFSKKGSLVVVADVFRATTAICAAMHHGVKEIIPVAEIAESEAYKAQGYIVAGERDGKKLACADFGNSPFNFMEPSLKGKTLVMNTTNGTQAIKMAADEGAMVAIGAFTNLSAISRYVLESKRNLVVFCSGWKNRFSMEDSLFAGALVEKVIMDSRGEYHTMCDSAIASADLWLLAKGDPLSYIQKAAHRHRLRHMGLDDILEYSLTVDAAPCLPVLKGDRLVNLTV